ncbi:MAG: CcdB family protein [Sulfurimonas sp.]
MAQFDVYVNDNESAPLFPYLLDITNKINSVSKMRVVVPLCNDQAAIKHLNPIFQINGEALYMSTMDIAGIPLTLCGKRVANLSDKRTEIIDALDFLINGF